MPHLFDYPLAIIDVETTGTNYQRGGVIDVGVLRIEQGRVVQTFNQLINPGAPVSAYIHQLTGISNDQLSLAPSFADIAEQLNNILADCIFVAHNARFDYAFIKEEFKRVDIRYAPKTFCTVKLSRSLYPQHRHHNLDALIERFNVPISNRHRALADAQATWHAMQTMVSQANPDTLEHIIKQQLRQPTLPPQLAKTTLDQLPSGPGVYIFTNIQGATLYVGKSINIKNRVISHFSDDVRSVKELTMSHEVADIKTIETAGELGALLLESQLIKSMAPIYNRALRRKKELVIAQQSQSPNGYPTIKIARYSPDTITDTQPIMAIFNSDRQAKETLLALAKEFQLCHRLLGLQNTTGACFAHQLGVCRGACLSKESALAYQLRFTQAFAQHRLQRWPYPGPILITEKDQDGQMADSFIVDNWRIINTIQQRHQETTTHQPPAHFDLDHYKILRRFLTKRLSSTIINPLQAEDLRTFAYDL